MSLRTIAVNGNPGTRSRRMKGAEKMPLHASFHWGAYQVKEVADQRREHFVSRVGSVLEMSFVE